MQRCLSIVTCLLLAAGTAGAQLEAGEAAPDFEGEWTHRASTSLLALRGRVILIDFLDPDDRWADEDYPRKLRKPLRDLDDKYADRGLVVLGVTSAPQERVDVLVERWSLTYPIARVAHGVIADEYGLDSLDRVYLVDVDTLIAWRGTIGRIDEQRIVSMLERATIVPPLPRHHEGLNRHLYFKSLDRGRAYRDVQKALERDTEDPDLQRVLRQLGELYARRADEAARLVAERDFAVAVQALETLMDDFGGCELADRAKETRSELVRDPDVRRDVSAAKLLDAARDLIQKGKEPQARRKLETLLRNFEDTKSAARAREELARLDEG